MGIFIKKKSGFTLIELLIIIAIIGLLSSIMLILLSSAKMRSNNTRRQVDLRQILYAEMMVMGDDEKYSCIKNPGNVATGYKNNCTTAADDIENAVGKIYLSVFLKDPIGTTPYNAVDNSLSDRSQFCVFAIAQGITPTQYYAVSHKGECITLTTSPATVGLDCWTTCPQ